MFCLPVSTSPRPTPMEIPLCLRLMLLWNLAFQIHAQTSNGFLNLACGMMPADSSFLDDLSNLTYISDASFIDSGIHGSIQNGAKPYSSQWLWYVRSFPEGIRNCYNLNVTRGNKYLVRAIFVYGNYDNRSEFPIFDVHIGPNKWATVDLEASHFGRTEEIIHTATSNNLQVCLVKTHNTTPVIASLQLRPMKDDLYQTQDGSSLMLSSRSFLSTQPKLSLIRFPDDVFDRIWHNLTGDWNQLKTTLPIDTPTYTFQPPERVMQTALTPKNSSDLSMSIKWTLSDPSSLIYLYMHFAELDDLKDSDIREFKIVLNGNVWEKSVIPKRLACSTVYSTSPKDCPEGNCEVRLVRTSRSTHPPILNAYEVYTVVNLQEFETDQTDVDAINRIKEFYRLNRISWRGDPCSPMDFLWDGLNCTYDLGPPHIISLNLSSSRLIGSISPAFQNLTQLKEMDLSNNNITGEVPDFLNGMTSLSFIDLRNNMLNGSIPEALLNRMRNGSITLYVQGNPNLYNSLDAKKNQNPNQGKTPKFVMPTMVVGVSLFFIITFLGVFFMFRRRSRSKTGTSQNSRAKNTFEIERRFTYSDVVKMTNNFERVIGKGGFGVVYHGVLNNTSSEQVAVKILSESSSSIGLKQFKTEVELLLRVHHKNLVHLVGYCEEDGRSALIYEYMPQGDLKNKLSEIHVLSWDKRVKIAAEAAQGLEYLHNGCKQKMVHRDIKTSNILLDRDFQAKVADFGLSKSFGVETNSHTSTVVAGTFGYLDPDYRRSGWLTEKSDVYSFGVVLLEILTNQPVIDHTREGKHISEWTNLVLTKGDIKDIVDPRLRGEFTPSSAWKMLEVAMSCVNPSSNGRPTMGYVVTELNECLVAETLDHNSNSNSLLSMSLILSDEFIPIAR